MTTHAWMLLPSGRRLDLLDPHPFAWTDEDLAVRLSRTYRWCSDTRWSHPLSVAQHSLTVLHLRQAASVRPLTPAERLRELLHDAEEGLLNHDIPTPLKPLLGEAYTHMTRQVRRCINQRYDLPAWDRDSHRAHKHADRLAAASEARHVVGWPDAEISIKLGIAILPTPNDPLPLQPGLQPWEPWPAHVAARLFREQLEQLQRDTLDSPDNVQIAAVLPQAMHARAASMPELAGHPTFVVVEGGGQVVEGQIVRGLRDLDGQWDLDSVFTVETEDGELVKVHGWNCITEVL